MFFKWYRNRMRNPYDDFAYDCIGEFMNQVYYNDIDPEFLVNFTTKQKNSYYKDNKLIETNYKELARAFLKVFQTDGLLPSFWLEEYPDLCDRIVVELEKIET